jgi:tRNA(Ile2)-agmatinylcytidine synthase
VTLGIDAPIRPYNYVSFRAVVAGEPEVQPGSHVVVRALASIGGGEVDLVFYREAFPLNRVAASLAPGDEVLVHGSVRPYTPSGRPVIAVDKIVVGRLSEAALELAPSCPRCGRRMKSMGAGKGYRCPRCGYTDRRASKLRVPLARSVAPGTYTPREGRLRHLTAPPGRKPRAWKPVDYVPIEEAASWSEKPPSLKPPG